jgi:hypothetical protein
MLGIISAVASIFTAVGGIAKGWFDHKVKKAEVARDVELAEIQAQQGIQIGSWKDEYLIILWTAPIIPALLDSVINWDPSMSVFLGVVQRLPVWYTSLLITITGASFGVRSMQNWKAAKLGREIAWEQSTNGAGQTSGHNGAGSAPAAPKTPGKNNEQSSDPSDTLAEPTSLTERG